MYGRGWDDDEEEEEEEEEEEDEEEEDEEDKDEDIEDDDEEEDATAVGTASDPLGSATGNKSNVDDIWQSNVSYYIKEMMYTVSAKGTWINVVADVHAVQRFDQEHMVFVYYHILSMVWKYPFVM